MFPEGSRGNKTGRRQHLRTGEKGALVTAKRAEELIKTGAMDPNDEKLIRERLHQMYGVLIEISCSDHLPRYSVARLQAASKMIDVILANYQSEHAQARAQLGAFMQQAREVVGERKRSKTKRKKTK